MKIVFFCGSLEPGRDGVGDYTRLLAVELIRQGHQTAIVSLNDAFIKEEYGATQNLEGIKLPVLRISHTMSAGERFKSAKEFTDAFTPDWLSLQFVPYSFQKKGLLFSQIKHFKYLTQGRNLHIMLHEAWIGKGPAFNFKKIVYSALQKTTIKSLFKTLKPRLIHTHIPYYFQQFKCLGWVMKRLPLFSNIPVVNHKHKVIDTKKITIGFFSQMEISDSILKFIKNLGENSGRNAMYLEIVLFGGSEARANTCKQILEREEALRNNVIVKGHLNNKELSITLQECTLGITPVPRHAVGKSGSVAAFIAHGVPVAAPNVLPGYLPTEIGFFNSKLCSSIITEPGKNQISTAKEAVVNARNEIELTTIAKTFISDLI